MDFKLRRTMNSSSAHSRSRAGTAGRKGAKGSRKGANGEGRAFIDETQDASEAAGANPKPGKRSYADVVRAGKAGREEKEDLRAKSRRRGWCIMARRPFYLAKTRKQQQHFRHWKERVRAWSWT